MNILAPDNAGDVDALETFELKMQIEFLLIDNSNLKLRSHIYQNVEQCRKNNVVLGKELQNILDISTCKS